MEISKLQEFYYHFKNSATGEKCFKVFYVDNSLPYASPGENWEAAHEFGECYAKAKGYDTFMVATTCPVEMSQFPYLKYQDTL